MTGRITIELHGVTREIYAGDYNKIDQLSKFLYQLTDEESPKKKAARWALDRSVTLLSQLRTEAGRLA